MVSCWSLVLLLAAGADVVLAQYPLTSWYEIEYVNTPEGLPCKLDDRGATYDGNIDVAHTKEPCLAWSDIANYTSLLEAANYSVTDMGSYCRAPILNGTTDMPEGPWCFTSSGPQYCIIPHCSVAQLASTRQCLLGTGFMSYAGSHTVDGQCVPWTDNSVQLQRFQLWMFPGSESWISMKDYCRNPDNDETVWCYNKTRLQTDGVLDKIYCGANIPECSLTCRVTEHSQEYVGDRTQSETTKQCLRAQDMIPPIFTTYAEKKFWFEEKYVNDNYDIDLFACRSYPDQYKLGVNEQGPVCYVNDTQTGQPVEESCSIYFCRNNDQDYAWLQTSQSPLEDSQSFVGYKQNVSQDVEDAWGVLSKSIPAAAIKESPRALVIGMCVLGTTVLLLIFLMFLDCASKKCFSSKCKKNADQMSNKLGSMISFRSNQVQPCDSSSVDETQGFVINAANKHKKHRKLPK